MNVRQARNESDFDDIKWLQKKCLPGDVILDPSEGYWWVVRDGEMPVAFCGMIASKNWQGTGYMCRAGVMPTYRGKGLQKRLIRVRISKAKRIGWTHLISDTRDNPPSANSLARMGFRMYHPRKPWAFKESLHWIKRL